MIVQALGMALMAVGGYLLAWYYTLTGAQQKEADRIAAHYAREIFDKTLANLSESELKHVSSLARNHFLN